ncbi:Putative rRNA-processing protein Fcf1/Utp23 [Septoria linicola]|uniref:U three protein 23 n=1 Tax=Septoria linicola TaxID=215465 RepID=A0A9Q9AZ24_9PEZI|nr:putative rRNA-processing protein Fcf1/Utp23 [Septoria linicola]USW54492.1 Putative rRNA-processing protein Fcf1/Utp23 [Septoria linicola]
MKGKRSKTYRKLMQKYQLNFDFREPYQVLVDAELIKDAARFKMQLGKMLENTLHGEIKPMITQCCIRHLYNAPADPHKDEWIDAAKQAERRRCGHHELPEPLSTLECLESVVDPKGSGHNKHRYVVASQDDTVRRKMRTIVGVPLVYIARSVMILEPMADVTEGVREREEKAKVKAGLSGRRNVGNASGEKRKRDDEDSDEDEREATAGAESAAKKQKRKGPKGPNPLAVKKSKKEKPAQKQADDQMAVIRKVTKNDPQAGEKAGLAVTADGHTEAPKKRRRKRKPKEAAEHGGVALGTMDSEDDD